MLRVPWEYQNLEPVQVEALQNELRRLSFPRGLRQSLKLERLLGGSAMLLSIRDQRGDAKLPLDPNTVQQGDLIATNVIPRTRISVQEYDNDPFSPTFGKPSIYNIWGTPVHRSRLLIFDGDPLTDNDAHDFGLFNLSREGFNVSVLAPVWDDIMRAAGTRQAAFHLIQRASILLILNENLGQMRAARTGKTALEELDNVADQLSMYHAAMIDGKNIQLDQWTASFGSVPQLLEQFLQIISAASDIPATRFLSQAPGGLNATGESDLENYYNMIEAKREERLRPILEQFLPIAGRSAFGDAWVALKAKIVFPALWNMSETDLASIRTQDTTNVMSVYNGGLISDGEALKELNERKVLAVRIDPDDPAREVVTPPGEDDDADITGILENLGALDNGDRNNGPAEAAAQGE